MTHFLSLLVITITHSWCLDLEGGAEDGAERGVINSLRKSSLVSLDLVVTGEDIQVTQNINTEDNTAKPATLPLLFK